MSYYQIDEDQLRWCYLKPKAGLEGDHHVIPENDIQEHQVSSDCWCCPIDDHEANEFVWLHNAKDGREAIELGTQKPN